MTCWNRVRRCRPMSAASVPFWYANWHTASGYGVRSCLEAKQSPGRLGSTSNTAVVLGLRDCYHDDHDNQPGKHAPEEVV